MGESLDRKTSILQDCWGWLRVHNQTHTNDLSRNPKEGQVPHRAAGPMMMMMMVVVVVVVVVVMMNVMNYENEH
jgi:hypothetical protein